MKTKEKICFFISWSREIDMFETIFSKFNLSNIHFIINDMNKEKRNNQKDIVNIEKYFKKKLIKNFSYLSNYEYSNKFRIVISTGDLPTSFISLISILKYLYGITIGFFLQFLNIDYFLKLKFGRSFTCGGRLASIYDKKFVEKKLAFLCIKFPNGLDRNIKSFPDKKWKKIFNVYLSSSVIEKKLIIKKFPNKEVFYIGYPRFDLGESNDKKNDLFLKKKFQLKDNQKTILCLPNERIISAQRDKDVYSYVEFLMKLNEDFNVILRPHPKLKDFNQNFFNIFKSSNLKLDLDNFSNIQKLIKNSDIVIGDYGSSILESIYLQKRIVIYEWPHERYFKVIYEKENCLDYLVRNKLIIIKHSEIEKSKKILVNLKGDNNYLKNITKLNNDIFGNKQDIKDPITVINNIYAN